MRLKLPFHPRAWLDSWLTYPRFLGTLKPELMHGAADEVGPRMHAQLRANWPRKLECPLAARILALSPHPDDEVIGCGGLLARHAGRADLKIVNVYNGDGGGALHEGPWRAEAGYQARLVQARREELDAAAKSLQASEVIRFEVSDCHGTPGAAEVTRLRQVLRTFKPEVVLLPWFLDNHPHHRQTNLLLADAGVDLSFMVLGYEVWGLLPPNAILDITDVLDQKVAMIQGYTSQLRTVDYVGYSVGLARTRAFHFPVRELRGGAVEAYLALPARDYCELAMHALRPPV